MTIRSSGSDDARRRVVVVCGFGSAGLREFVEIRAAGNFEFVFAALDDFDDAALDVLRHAGLAIRAPDARTLAASLVEPVDGVLTFADSAVVAASELAVETGVRGPDPAATRRARSKYEQRIALNDAGVSSIRTWRIPDSRKGDWTAPEGLVFPVVAKPEFGASSEYVFLAEDLGTLETIFNETPPTTPFVVEEMLPAGIHDRQRWLGDYGSVESVVVDGEVIHFGSMDRLPLVPHFREGGPVVPSALSRERLSHVHDTAERAIRALGLNNVVTHTEVSYGPSEPAVIEVNCRLGGFVHGLYRRTAGFSSVEVACAIATGVFDPAMLADPSRCAVAFHVNPPIGAVAAKALPSANALRKLPGVWQVDQIIHRSGNLDWRRGGGSRLFDIWIEGEDHDALRINFERVVEYLEKTITYFRPDA